MKTKNKDNTIKTAILLGSYLFVLVFLYSFVEKQGYVDSFALYELKNFMYPFFSLTGVLMLLLIKNKVLCTAFVFLLQLIGALFSFIHLFLTLPLLACLWLIKYARQGIKKSEVIILFAFNVLGVISGILTNISRANHFGLLPFSMNILPLILIFVVYTVLITLLFVICVKGKKSAGKKSQSAHCFTYILFFNVLVLANTVWYYVRNNNDERLCSFLICLWFVYAVCFGCPTGIEPK